VSKRLLRARKAPVQERSRATLEALIEAAAQVFVRDGYAQATTEAIAARAGVSIGSFYQYFEDKEALLVTLAERHVDEGNARIAARLLQVAGRPLDELVAALVAEMFDHHRARPELHRILFQDAPYPDALRLRMVDHHLRVVEAVEALLGATPGVEGISRVQVYLAVHTVEGIAHQAVLIPDPTIDEADLQRELVEMVTSMLLRPSGRAGGG
jgi:AcrR family transcriptional regulator